MDDVEEGILPLELLSFLLFSVLSFSTQNTHSTGETGAGFDYFSYLDFSSLVFIVIIKGSMLTLRRRWATFHNVTFLVVGEIT